MTTQAMNNFYLSVSETCYKHHLNLTQEFSDGKFVVFIAKHLFSAMVIDQAHEQENAEIKGKEDVVGVTENPSALRRWMIAGPEVIHNPLVQVKLLNGKEGDVHLSLNPFPNNTNLGWSYLKAALDNKFDDKKEGSCVQYRTENIETKGETAAPPKQRGVKEDGARNKTKTVTDSMDVEDHTSLSAPKSAVRQTPTKSPRPKKSSERKREKSMGNTFDKSPGKTRDNISEKRASARTTQSIRCHVARISGRIPYYGNDETKPRKGQSGDKGRKFKTNRSQTQQGKTKEESGDGQKTMKKSKCFQKADSKKYASPTRFGNHSDTNKVEKSNTKSEKKAKVQVCQEGKQSAKQIKSKPADVKKVEKSSTKLERRAKIPADQKGKQSAKRSKSKSIEIESANVPDTPRSLNESEYCYSPDPDWDTSTSSSDADTFTSDSDHDTLTSNAFWDTSTSLSSETSSDAGPRSARVQRTIQRTIRKSFSQVGDESETSDGTYTSSYDRSTSSWSSGDSHPRSAYYTDSTDSAGHDSSGCDHEMISESDTLSEESFTSYTPQISETDLILEKLRSENKLEKQTTGSSESRTGRSGAKDSPSKNTLNESKDEKPVQKRKLDGYSKTKNVGLKKGKSDVEPRRIHKETRRFESESVVRGCREYKKERNPRLQRKTAKPGTDRCGKGEKNKNMFNREVGKDTQSTAVERLCVQKMKKQTGKYRINDNKSSVKKENGMSIGDKVRDKRLNSQSTLSKKLDTHPKQMRKIEKDRSKNVKSTSEKVGAITKKDSVQIRSQIKTVSKIDRKPSIKCSLPKKSVNKSRSRDSMLSDDDAVMCEGYVASSSASSLISEVADTDCIDGHVLKGEHKQDKTRYIAGEYRENSQVRNGQYKNVMEDDKLVKKQNKSLAVDNINKIKKTELQITGNESMEKTESTRTRVTGKPPSGRLARCESVNLKNTRVGNIRKPTTLYIPN